ncbi:MAG: DUF7718 family protein [Thermomicrobiales bacterium]
MVDRHTGRYLAPDVFFHKRFIAERGHLVGFALQIDVWEDDRWCPVIRCDSSHGEAHIDEIDPEGKTFRKVWLGIHRPYDTVYNDIEAYLGETWKLHVERWNAQKGASK